MNTFDHSHLSTGLRDERSSCATSGMSTPRRAFTWNPCVLSLTRRESELIEREARTMLGDANGFPPMPEDQVAFARKLAERIEERCCPRLAQALARLPFEGDSEAHIVYGLPVAEEIASLVQLATSALIGDPFNYAEQLKGQLSMRLVPEKNSASNTNTTANEFKMHSDDAVMPENLKATWISLYPVRNPPQTLTGYAPIRPSIHDMKPKSVKTLFCDRFAVGVPTSFGMGENLWSKARPILGKDAHNRTTIAWPSYATRPVDPDDVEAVDALSDLAQAMQGQLAFFPLMPGTLLIFSNLHGIHMRTPITDYSRLVLRNYIRRDLTALRKKSGHAGFVFKLDSLGLRDEVVYQ